MKQGKKMEHPSQNLEKFQKKRPDIHKNSQEPSGGFSQSSQGGGGIAIGFRAEHHITKIAKHGVLVLD